MTNAAFKKCNKKYFLPLPRSFLLLTSFKHFCLPFVSLTKQSRSFNFIGQRVDRIFIIINSIFSKDKRTAPKQLRYKNKYVFFLQTHKRRKIVLSKSHLVCFCSTSVISSTCRRIHESQVTFSACVKWTKVTVSFNDVCGKNVH